MADKSQEVALALLKEAKEKGALDPTIEAGLAELIGTASRPKVQEVLETLSAPKSSVSTEQVEAEKRELSSEQVDKLIKMLKTRFELADPESHGWVDFADVEESLREYPEALFQIQKLEETGEVHIVGESDGEFIFTVSSAKVGSLENPCNCSLRVRNYNALSS